MGLLAFLPFLILLGGVIALPAINRFRPDFRSNWLLSAALALIALLILFYLRVRLPIGLSLGLWTLDFGAPSTGALWQLDAISLPFAVALLALGLAVIVVDIARAVTEPWFYWLPQLGLAALSLLAVMAGNPLALAIAWTLLDALILGLSLLWLHERREQDFLLHRQALGVLSVLLLIGAALLSRADTSSTFVTSDSLATLLMALAAGLRLGALPFNPHLSDQLSLRSSQSVSLRMLPAASALALLARLDLGGLLQAGPWLLLLLLGALYCAARWLQHSELEAGLPFWLAGMASLAMSALFLGAPLAAQALGLAWLLGGGLLALSTGGGRAWQLLFLFGLLGLGALPFTPAFGLMQLFSGGLHLEALALLLPYGLLLYGWLRQAWRRPAVGPILEPWARTIYLSALFALPVIHILLALGLAPQLAPRNLTTLPFWPAAIPWAAAGLALVLSRRGRLLPVAIGDLLDRVFSLRWLYDGLGRLLAAIQAVFNFLSELLEGQAGVLWALVLITLLLSLIAQLALET